MSNHYACGIVDADATRSAAQGILFGRLLSVCVSEKGVRSIHLSNESSATFSSCGEEGEKIVALDEWPLTLRDMFREVERELQAYGAGTLRRFSVPIDGDAYATWHSPRGEYWRALREIPYGETVTYGELAMRSGRQKSAARAAGQACAKNPWLILIPCHRVIASSLSSSLLPSDNHLEKRLGGFGGGLELKKRLLYHEKM